MCLAIPGQIVEIVDIDKQIAKAQVSGVRRNINVGLLEPHQAAVGNWVLIHVGFALSQIDEEEALTTLRLLREMGTALDEELEMMDQSADLRSFEVEPPLLLAGGAPPGALPGSEFLGGADHT